MMDCRFGNPDVSVSTNLSTSESSKCHINRLPSYSSTSIKHHGSDSADELQ